MATGQVSLAEIEKRVPRVVQQAQQIAVNDADDYEFACAFLRKIDADDKVIDDFFDSDIAKAYQLHRSLTGKKKMFKDPLKAAKDDVGIKVGQYRLLEERKKHAEEDRLSAIAKKDADDRAMAEAAHLAANGEKELADIVIQEAAAAPAPVVVLESSVPKEEGISGRNNWKFRIVDETQIPREFLEPSMVKIGAIVRSQKSMTKIPGVQVWNEPSVNVRQRNPAA
jgi:hypothetical protein